MFCLRCTSLDLEAETGGRPSTLRSIISANRNEKGLARSEGKTAHIVFEDGSHPHVADDVI